MSFLPALMQREAVDKVGWVLRAAATLSMIGFCFVLLMVVAFAVPTFTTSATGGPFSWEWDPYSGKFGILPMVTGSLLLAFSALLLAWPMAFLLCCWLLGVGNGWLQKLVHGLIRFMAAIPTVVYGFTAVFLLTPLIRLAFGGAGMGWFAAAFMVVLLILPSMTMVMEAGLRSRLSLLYPESLALGFTRLELLYFFVLPQARKTFFAAGILGFGRAMGDTLLPLMLAGNAPQVPAALNDGLRTLTAHMALVTANEVGGGAYDSLFAAGVLLLAINALVSIVLRLLRGKK